MPTQPPRYYATLLFLLVTIIALGFLKSPGTVDVGAFMDWTTNITSYGIIEGYRLNDADYPPGNSLMLYTIAWLSDHAGLERIIGFKLSLFLFLLLTTLIFWAWTRDLFLAVMLELALTLSSVAQGYTDIHIAPTLLLSLWALQKRHLTLFTLLYGATCLIKWQPIIIAPVLLLYLLQIDRLADWRHINWRELGLGVLLPAGVVTAVLLYLFRLEMFEALRAGTRDGLFSGNALNFNWIITHGLRQFRPDWFGGLQNGLATWIDTRDPRFTTLPKLLFGFTFALSCYLCFRHRKTFPNLLRFTLLAFLSYFMFNTGVHENHLFMAVMLVAMLAGQDRAYLPEFAAWAIAANANLFFFYGANGQGVPFDRVAFIDVALLLAGVNLLLYGRFLHHVYTTSPQIPSPQTTDRIYD